MVNDSDLVCCSMVLPDLVMSFQNQYFFEPLKLFKTWNKTFQCLYQSRTEFLSSLVHMNFWALVFFSVNLFKITAHLKVFFFFFFLYLQGSLLFTGPIYSKFRSKLPHLPQFLTAALDLNLSRVYYLLLDSFLSVFFEVDFGIFSE